MRGERPETEDGRDEMEEGSMTVLRSRSLNILVGACVKVWLQLDLK